MRVRLLAEYAGLAVVLLVLVAFFGMRSQHFLTLKTFSTIVNQVPALTVISAGMTLVLILGGIDLSVGSVMALSGALLGVAMDSWEWPMWAAAALAMAGGTLCGWVNGMVSVGWGVPSFIVTLGMLEVARGGAFYLTSSQTIYVGDSVAGLSKPMDGMGISMAFLISAGVVIACQVLLDHTVFGRHALAVGANEETARLSGIRPGRIRVAVFALLGLLTGLAGVFQTSRLNAADPNAGVGLELSAIAAVVIGGTSLMGGRGSVINTFFGVLIIAVLQTGLAHLGMSEPSKRIVTGLVIAAAVIGDVYRQRLSSRQN